MPWFDYDVYRRSPGGPARLQRETCATFEANTADAAMTDAYRRSRSLPAGDFAVLKDADGAQLWTGEAPWH